MSSNSEAVKRTREKRKAIMLESMGGECTLCGYTEPAGLVIHHIDPAEKQLNFSNVRANNTNWTTVVTELRKCTLLCANCHNKVHAEGLDKYNFVSSFIEKFATIQTGPKGHLNPEIYIRNCLCGKQLSAKQLKYCSAECMGKDRSLKGTLVDWDAELPNIKYLREVDKLTYKEIGILYSVSDKTVAKHYKNKYG